MAGGASGQVGFKTETTVGTAITVDTFIPIVSENIKNNKAYLDSKTISARQTLRMTKPGAQQIEGSITTELPNRPLATLLTHMFGNVVTSGAGPYTHTATPASTTGKTLTVQVGRPATTDTVHPFTYAGCKVNEWTIACTQGEIASLELALVGMTETTATALATASYSATWQPYTFVEGSVSIAGTPVGTVRALTLTGSNQNEIRHRIGTTAALQPLATDLREFTGSISTDFDALTHYNLFVNGTQAAVVLAFSNGTDTLTITMNVIFTGETPEIGGFELLEQALPFRAFSATSDAAAITAVLVNGETSAA